MAKTQAERAKAYRDGKRDAQPAQSVTVRDVTAERDGSFYEACVTVQPCPEPAETVAEQLLDAEVFHSRPHYATRANPDKLNWGKHMTSTELADAGLRANRVPIPGDHDYAGVCNG